MLAAQEAFKTWRLMPAPKRGEIVRQRSESMPPQRELRGDPSAAFTDDFAREVPMPIN